MKPIMLNGERLTLDQLWQIAKEDCPVELDQEALRVVKRSHEVVERAIDEGKKIYGVTTGFGKLSDVKISTEDTSQLQLNLLRSHACGVGSPVPSFVSRAMMTLKLNNLLRGFSGIRPEVLLLLKEFLNRGVSPVVPSKGSVGASGDLAPLSHLSLVLIGEGEAEWKGKRLPGKEALEAAELNPIALQAKEGLSLINGTQFMTALAALGVIRARKLARTADIIAAMTADGMKATPIAFDSRIQAVRNQPGQMPAAQNLTALMEDSEIRISHLECKKVQDAYSIRCIPQVHGSCREVISFVEQTVTHELNAVTDNPLVFPVEGEIISGGNFHGEPVAMALDFLSIALAELANISERRIALMMDSSFSELTDFLTPKPGLNSGFMQAQITAASLVSENKTLSFPASVDSIPTSANKEDHVSMGANAANKMWQVLENAEIVLAIESVSAAQSIDLRAPLQPGAGVKLALDQIRNKVPFLDNDRNLSEDIEKARKLVSDFMILEAVEAKIEIQ